jgi:hypothetical protein
MSDVAGTITLTLEPTSVSEWDAEDLAFGDLSDTAEMATEAEARQIFDGVTLNFPRVCLTRDLADYAAQHDTPLGEAIIADGARFDFYLMELPVNILIPESRKLTRLRLSLDAAPTAQAHVPVVAYDLFPTDKWHAVTHDVGSVSVDVSRALTFLYPVVGDVLGLKLAVPIRWTSQYVAIRTTDRLSNPVVWDVSDDTIGHGFTGYVIWRTAKGAGLTVTATLLGELRSTGLSRLRKAQFRTDSKNYPVPE